MRRLASGLPAGVGLPHRRAGGPPDARRGATIHPSEDRNAMPLRSRRSSRRLLDAVPVRATGIDLRGPALRGPAAMAALAFGAGAGGALAIGRLAIGRASIRRLAIGELEVGRLHVEELVVDREAPRTGAM
jgi:hypothetical protein